MSTRLRQGSGSGQQCLGGEGGEGGEEKEGREVKEGSEKGDIDGGGQMDTEEKRDRTPRSNACACEEPLLPKYLKPSHYLLPTSLSFPRSFLLLSYLPSHSFPLYVMHGV